MKERGEPRRILITGAFGFVGTNLIEGFGSKYQLQTLDISDRDISVSHLFYNWQELDKIDWDGLDTVIHLAGKAHDTKNIPEEHDYFDINVGLTVEMYNRFSASKARKFIYFSSVKAVADEVPGSFLTEEHKPDPKTPYGRSKLAAEQILLKLATSNLQLSKRSFLYILRPCMIHGPGNKGNLKSLVNFVKKGFPWPLGAFENQRSFTSINNLVFVVEQLIENDIEAGIYNVADDETCSTNELIHMISETLGHKMRIWNLPSQLIRVTSKIGDIFRLPMNSERLKKLTESYLVSNKKLKNALGIEKMPFTAIEGMKKTISLIK